MGKATAELMKKAKKSSRGSKVLSHVDGTVRRVHKGPVPKPTHMIGTRG